MTTPSLALEIVENIIDHCDMKTLAECSLVCSQWMARSRYQRFRCLLFIASKSVGDRIVNKFTFLHSTECTIPLYVKKVVILYDSSIEIARLLPTFALLTKTQSLVISSLPVSPKGDGIEGGILNGIAQIFPDLRTLGMRCDALSMKKPASFLSSFPNLEKLDFRGKWTQTSNPQDEEDSSLTLSPPPASLRVLKVSNYFPELAHWFLQCHIFPNLTELTLEKFILCATHPHLNISSFWNSLGPALKTLSLVEKNKSRTFNPVEVLRRLDMSVFTSLEHFQVTLSRTQPRHTLLLHGLLSKLKSPVLKEVHFDVGMAIFSHSTAWSDIDEVLSKLQSPFLKCVTFTLHECFVLQRRIEVAFPLCGQKGILQYRLRIQIPRYVVHIEEGLTLMDLSQLWLSC